MKNLNPLRIAFLTLVLTIFGCSNFQYNENGIGGPKITVISGTLDIHVVFSHKAKNATLVHNFNGQSWKALAMEPLKVKGTKISGGFSHFYRPKMYVGNYNFNINTEIWKSRIEPVATKAGVRAKEVIVNGVRLTRDYITIHEDGKASFSFHIEESGHISPGAKKGTLYPAYIPADSMFPEGHKRHATPPGKYNWLMPIVHFVHDPSFKGKSFIRIGRLGLNAKLTNGKIVKLSDMSFTKEDNHSKWFGFYNLSPWFTSDRQEKMQMDFSSEKYMECNPHLHPQKIYHFWGKRVECPENTEYLIVELYCRFQGVSLQIGLDGWISADAEYKGPDINNTELGASTWFNSQKDSTGVLRYTTK